jgi:predicted transposase YdaD
MYEPGYEDGAGEGSMGTQQNFSAIEHGQSTDILLAKRIATAAILASAGIDVERSRLYLDLIQISFSQNIPEAFEITMNSLGYEYQGAFARRYYGQGKTEGQMEGWAKGKAEGRMELILELLAFRFGPLTETAQARVRGAQDVQLNVVAERMLTAKTIEEALSQLF